MTPNTPIKTLIVEDMEVLTLGMCEVLETLPMAQVVATAGNTEEARRFL